MTATTPAPQDDSEPAEVFPVGFGEEVQILTLNEVRLEELKRWCAKLQTTPDRLLLGAFDLLTRRLATLPPGKATLRNPNLFVA